MHMYNETQRTRQNSDISCTGATRRHAYSCMDSDGDEENLTRDKLEAYRDIQDEIAELRYRIAHLGENDSLIGNDVIMDYRSGYPVPQSVVGYDFVRESQLKAKYAEQIESLRGKKREIEEYIENIPDSLTRRIFRMYFLDGMPQSKIAKRVHASQSTVSNKISVFLKLHTINKKVCYDKS